MRTRKNKFILMVAAIICHPFFFLSQEVGFNDFLMQVRSAHPEAIRNANISRIGDLGRRAALGFYDPMVAGGIEQKNFNGKDYYVAGLAEVRQQLFAGQFLKAGYELGQGPYVNPEIFTPAAGIPYLGVEVALLQGMFINKGRYELLKAEQYQKMNESESRMGINDLLLGAAQIYTDWIRDHAIAGVNEKYVNISADRLEALKVLSDIGERPFIDTVEAAILFQNRVNDYLNARTVLNKSLYTIGGLRWQNDSNLRWSQLSPAGTVAGLSERCLRAFSSRAGESASSNPLLGYYRSRGELLGVERRYAAELIKPRLDLKYNFLGNNIPQGPLLSNNYKWGAGFSMPLFLRTPLNNHRIAGLELRNNSLDLQAKTIKFNNDMEIAAQNLKLIAEQMVLAERTVKYSRSLLEAEKIRFDNNESSLFLLNVRESRLLEAEIKLLEVQHKFVYTYFSYVWLEGRLEYELE